MNRRLSALITLVASALLATGCAQRAGAPSSNQDGPLEFGSDTNGPPGNTYCSAWLKAGSKVGFADVVTNPTKDPARLLSVDLQNPVNLHAGEGRAWDSRKEGALYYWSYKVAEDNYFKKPLAAMGDAAGYDIGPGREAGVAVPAEVAESGKDVTVGRLIIKYSVGGKEYTEVSNTEYELKPGGCGA